MLGSSLGAGGHPSRHRVPWVTGASSQGGVQSRCLGVPPFPTDTFTSPAAREEGISTPLLGKQALRGQRETQTQQVGVHRNPGS